MAVCIAGHVGVGHSFSHSGFVQDDSLGFSTVGHLLQQEFGVRTRVAAVRADPEAGLLTVETEDGGVGRAQPRRGMTPFEADLLKRLEGQDALFPHRSVLAVFGRAYGHGVTEVPVAAEYALSAAALDTFHKRVSRFVLRTQDDPIASDVVGGIELRLGPTPVVLLLTVNGSREGVGPVEDLEGNVSLHLKGELMKELGVRDAPCIVVESKAYVPSLAVAEERVLVRFNRTTDNSVVGACLEQACQEAGIPHLVVSNAFPRQPGSMRRRVLDAARTLTDLAERLAASEDARTRADILASLARALSEDLGGVIFMSNQLNDQVGDAGLMPGTAAVISKAVPRSYVDRVRMPYVTEDDVATMGRLVRRAAQLLWSRYEEAMGELREKGGGLRESRGEPAS